MTRIALVVSIVMLAGCTERDATAPDRGIGLPLMAITVGLTDCDAGALNSIDCTFDFSLDEASSFGVDVTGVWTFSYQCMHEKTGKTNKKYDLLTVQRTAANSFSGSGSSASGTVTVNPPSTPTDLCTNNKGPFTEMVSLGFVPTAWRIEILSESSGSAIVEGTI